MILPLWIDGVEGRYCYKELTPIPSANTFNTLSLDSRSRCSNFRRKSKRRENIQYSSHGCGINGINDNIMIYIRYEFNDKEQAEQR